MKANRPNASDDQRSLSEIARTRDEAVRRALNTPPKPLKERKGKDGKQQAKPTASGKKP